MTRYMDKDRRAERGRLHRLMLRFNFWFAVLVLAVLLPSVASAAPRCPGGGGADAERLFVPDRPAHVVRVAWDGRKG